MAQVQFTSAPPYHPSPFAIYNNQAKSDFSDIGHGLTALGGIPQQFQQATIKDELGKLLIQALTAPRTEQRPITTMTPPDDTSLGGLLAGQPTTTIRNAPGKDYTESTGRLGDVGYSGQGFNFNKKNKLEDLMTMEILRQQGRTDLEGTKAENRVKTEEARNKAAMERLIKNQEGRKLISDAHDKTMEKIAGDKNSSIEKRAANALAESARHHMASEANAAEANSIRRKNAGTMHDIQVTDKINQYLDDLSRQRSQIDKLAQGDLTDPSRQTEYRSALEQYNNLAKSINGLDPNISVTEYKERDTPQGIGNWLRGLGHQIAPTIVNPPSPTLSPGAPAVGTPRSTSPTPRVTPTPSGPTVAPNTPRSAAPTGPSSSSLEAIKQRRKAMEDARKQQEQINR